MHVISRKRLVEFGKAHADAVTPLDAWYRLIKGGRFTSPEALKATFASVDFLGGRVVVFNIGGTKYRLVAHVRYTSETNVGRVYVQHVFTHEEYAHWSDERRRGHA